MFYIYILYSVSSNKYYVGYSNDYQRRFIGHDTSERITYTGKHRLWILKAAFECSLVESDAINVERFIKRQKSRRLLELLSDPTFTPFGHLVQLVRVP